MGTQAEAHLGKALPTQRLLSLARVGLCSPRAPVNQVDPASWQSPPATCDYSGWFASRDVAAVSTSALEDS